MLESALEGGITGHLGYEKHDPAGSGSGNSGPVGTAVPRDREGSFEPQIVKKRQPRLTGQDWDKISRSPKPVCTAPTAKAAEDRFLEFAGERSDKCPAIVRLWENAWAEFVPFLQFDAEIHRIVCTTNTIKSVNARIRKAVRARGHFPNEAAALKRVYIAVISLDPTGQGRKHWTMRRKPAFQAFDITSAADSQGDDLHVQRACGVSSSSTVRRRRCGRWGPSTAIATRRRWS